MRKFLERSLIPSAILVLALTLGALAQGNFAVGLGSQIVATNLQRPQYAATSDLNIVYRGLVGDAVVAPVYSLISGGPPVPVLTGSCTTGSQIGFNQSGSFTATCTAQTVIMTFATTAPHGWNCDAHDQTTPADNLLETSNTTTSCTLTGTTAAADVILFTANAY